ncbi:UPF0758 domain-containing protein, partial [Escherichia sp. HC-CC]
MKNNSQLLMPREKMLKFGISALTDVELLALFLRTGTRGKDVLTLAKESRNSPASLL